MLFVLHGKLECHQCYLYLRVSGTQRRVVIKGMIPGVMGTWVQILALTLISCAIVGMWFNLLLISVFLPIKGKKTLWVYLLYGFVVKIQGTVSNESERALLESDMISLPTMTAPWI